MPEHIFRRNPEGGVTPLSEVACDIEDDLQELIASNPALLVSVCDSISKLILVTREAKISGVEEGSNSFSLDILFFDQDGTPTFVEVKRCADTRIRREVIGQVIDYAAYAYSSWTIETLKGYFLNTCGERDLNPDEVLNDFVGIEENSDNYWNLVKTNLQAGRFRLIFLADIIPPNLKRVVEFLNSQMDPTEVLAIEIRQFFDNNDPQIIVPTLFGQTIRSEQKKGTRIKHLWTEPEFYDRMSEYKNDLDIQKVKKILANAKDLGYQVKFGKGATAASMSLYINWGGKEYKPITFWESGGIEFLLEYLRNRPGFTDDNKRKSFLNRINSMTGLSFTEDSINLRPSIQLEILDIEDNNKIFLEILEWFAKTVKEETHI